MPSHICNSMIRKNFIVLARLNKTAGDAAPVSSDSIRLGANCLNYSP